MKALKFLSLLGFTAILGSCDLGNPTGGGTGGEGLTGIIVDPQGSPIAGAIVRLYPDSTLTAGPGIDSSVTNALGKYSFKDRKRGHYNVASIVVRGSESLALFLRNLNLNATREQGVDTMQVAGQVVLSIKDASNQPLVGATCAIPASPWGAVSDSAGRCALSAVASGSQSVNVSAAGVAPITEKLMVEEGVTEQRTLYLIAPSSNPLDPISTTLSLNIIARDVDTIASRLNPWDWMIVTLSAADSLIRDSISASSFLNTNTSDTIVRKTYFLKPLRNWKVVVDLRDTNGLVVAIDSVSTSTIGAGLVRQTFLTLSPRPAPSAPVLNIPVDGNNSIDAGSAVLSWQPAPSESDEISNYLVEVSTDTSFSSAKTIQVLLQSATTSWLAPLGMVSDEGETLIAGLVPGQRYYWRVSAVGARVSRSLVRSFITLSAFPAVRTLVDPADEATGLSLSPTLSWRVSASGGSARYFRVQVSTEALFGTMAVNDSVTTPVPTASGSSWTVSGLQPSTRYYWRILAVGDLDATSYSSVRSFTTAP